MTVASTAEQVEERRESKSRGRDMGEHMTACCCTGCEKARCDMAILEMASGLVWLRVCVARFFLEILRWGGVMVCMR